MTTITITREHAYPVGVAVASSLFVVYLSVRAGIARSKAKIPLPYMYAERAEAEKDPVKHVFNCTQRSHQNMLEMYPLFLVLLSVSSIRHPTYAAVAGLIFLAGRAVYSHNYSAGHPEARKRGGFFMIGALGLIGMAVSTAVSLITA
ncbi:hypothetical protein BC831DRAFT_515271 [Entophlyctis helioformis]|nr:hypothetical protein BC831DRAFT_515271 [Entophlyctis helioformis]